MYAENWLTGEATTAMLPEQEGAYVRLMCYAWLATPPCSIPDDDKVLAYVSKLGARWKRLGKTVKARFDDIGDGRLREPRLFQIYLDREEYRRLQQEKGRKGGRPKAETKPEVSQHESRDLNRKNLSVAVSVSESESEENTSQSQVGRSGSTHDNRLGRPLWTHNQFRYKADKISEWINQARTKHKRGPGDEDFDAAFELAWGMGYSYWIEQRDLHEAHFSALREVS